ncbi:MAG: Sec-independent protein translocase protein TatB [Deltaproteobacteria bacterium]|nr:Sec-independent protein translocase protein TatB [Deltaproteobacteria bacterium]
MFGIGWTELVVILFVMLVAVGPKQLPGMARKLGKLVAELRQSARELRNQIDVEISDLESPSEIAKSVGREIMKDLPSPYDEARGLDEALRKITTQAEPRADGTPEGGDPGPKKSEP